MACCSEEKTNENVDHKQSCCNATDQETGDSCCENTKEKSQTERCTHEIDVSSGTQAAHCQTGSDVSDSCCSSESTVTTNANDQAESKKLEYRISGMDCPSCAATIEKGLKKLKSVVDANVSYSTEKLYVHVTDDFSEMELEKTIQNLGFNIDHASSNTHKKTYVVEGMDCGSCAKTIENHLSNVSGVQDVKVNFSTGMMKVVHNNPTSAIVQEVSKVGFRASLEEQTSEQTEKPKHHQELRKIIFSGILVAVGFIGTYVDVPSILNTLLFAMAIVLSGYKPAKSAYYAVKSRSLDMNVLMASAAVGAALIGEWFEGATVVWLFSLGIYLQDKSMNQTRESIRGLMDLAPSMAWVKSDQDLIQKPVEEITRGEIIVIKPGDKVPLDGTVLDGETSINQAPITGESIPVDKVKGSHVFAGTVNESGSVTVEVTNLAEDTTLSKIIHLVEEAQEKKAPTEAFIDKFASIYTPVVFIAALAVIVLPPLVGVGDWGEWTYKGLALLVVACPCALVISTPVAIVSAIGTAARNGVLIKGGNFLETVGAVHAIAFDKTGTLTNGKPVVSDIYPLQGMTKDKLLSIAYTLEEYSTHPIAQTIVEYVQSTETTRMQGAQFKTIAGKGVEATIDDVKYYAGSPKLFKEINIPINHAQPTIDDLQHNGKTVVLIGTEKEIFGIIAVRDTIRSITQQTMTLLKEEGLSEVIMLTGDNEGTAALITKEANVDRYFAELLPEDKVQVVKELQREGRKVAMVGDGINDAPALATADLGIAMGGTGTDTAMETADIILMADNLEKIPYTVKLSKKAITIIKQNIWFSLLIKFIALVLIFPGWLTLWMAVLSDSGAAIIVILNSLRLVRKKAKDKQPAELQLNQ